MPFPFCDAIKRILLQKRFLVQHICFCDESCVYLPLAYNSWWSSICAYRFPLSKYSTHCKKSQFLKEIIFRATTTNLHIFQGLGLTVAVQTVGRNNLRQAIYFAIYIFASRRCYVLINAILLPTVVFLAPTCYSTSYCVPKFCYGQYFAPMITQFDEQSHKLSRYICLAFVCYH